MGWLAPLYLAGALAIGLPILFHLIRRTPHGRQDFSSLMFLSASPPRLTRRSRLNNILLLILRATALILLAIAFARPFFHNASDLDVSKSSGRRVAILVDTSASMRRGDLWTQANAKVDEVLKEASPADEVALFLFDRSVRPAFTFDEWNQTDPARRVAMLKSRLAEAKPTWAPTKMGEALASVADLLGEREGPKNVPDKMGRQLVLISDLQQGGHVEALQGHQWPTNVLLEVKPVATKQATNASLQFVKQTVDVSEKPDGKLRVRVNSGADSSREQFTLTWANDRGPVAGFAPLSVYVPPGRSQIVRVPWPAKGEPADRLVLAGDDSDFDNTMYVVPPRTDSVRVVYVGDDSADDIKGLRYYLESAMGGTTQRKVELAARRASEALSEAELVGARLVVVTTPPAEAKVAALRRFVERGGDVLWVLKDASGGQALSQMMKVGDVKVEEAAPKDFSLIGRVDMEHLLFAPFADARFGDFTKIHFWRHRKVTPPAGVRVLASFDGGDPFLIEQAIGQGKLLMATSGWHPADSQLALSTKFVPLLEGLLRRKDQATVEAQYMVFEPVALPSVATGQGARTVIAPDGAKTEVPGTSTTFEGADKPGVFKLVQDGQETPLAVNLPADESRTAPVAVEELERWGAKLGSKPASDEIATRERRLRQIELENRQKLWRWLIVAVLGLLAVETALAGVLAKRTLKQATT
jgi:hypothetical protein